MPWETCREGGVLPILRTAVTGYGEDLVRAAVASMTALWKRWPTTGRPVSSPRRSLSSSTSAARTMKAIYVRDGASPISRSMRPALRAAAPSSRPSPAPQLRRSRFRPNRLQRRTNPSISGHCTVFTNSRGEAGAPRGGYGGEISAGLAFVIRNFLHKILKLKDPVTLGERIVVQGGDLPQPRGLRLFSVCRVEPPNAPGPLFRRCGTPVCEQRRVLPAVILIGNIVKAFQSGKHDPEKTTVLLTGDLRAVPGVELSAAHTEGARIRRVRRGVPVISLSAERRVGPRARQPGGGGVASPRRDDCDAEGRCRKHRLPATVRLSGQPYYWKRCGEKTEIPVQPAEPPLPRHGSGG